MKQLHDALIACCMHSNATDLSLYNIYVCFSVRLTVFLLFISIYASVSKQLSDPLHVCFASKCDRRRKTTPVSCKRTVFLQNKN